MHHWCICVLWAGGSGYKTKKHRSAIRPAAVHVPHPRSRAKKGNFSQLRDKFSRSDSLKDKRVDGWGVTAGERQR